MTSRVRGEHAARWGRWRPIPSRGDSGESRIEVPPDGQTRLTGWRGAARRPLVCLAALAAAAVLGVAILVASGWGSAPAAPAVSVLPSSPRAWLDEYEGAVIDDPGLVCSVLFAPQLAQVYGAAEHGSCTGYFRRITSYSVVVRRVLRDGGTAVLQLRQSVSPRDWAVVLDRCGGGWQAVDLLAGALVR